MFLPTDEAAELAPKQRVKLFIVMWLVAGLIYLPAWKGGFMFDFEGLIAMMRREGFWGVLNRNDPSIERHSLYQLTQLQLYGWVKLLGTRPALWFILFITLHALNGLLLFTFCRNLFREFGLSDSYLVAGAGAFLFLINPNLTEVVIWKASYHYLVGIQIVLWMLIWGRKYLLSGKANYAVWCCILYALSTFTLEIFYVIPFMLLLLGIAYRNSRLVDSRHNRRLVGAIVIPQVLLLGLHLLLYHFVYGGWISHNAKSSTDHTSIATLAGRIISYEFHGIFLGRFFPDNVRHAVYTIANNSVTGWFILAIIILFAVISFVQYSKWSALTRVIVLLVGWSLLALATILLFAPEELFVVGNDRHLYFTMAFQCMLIAVIVGALLPARVQLFRWGTAVLLLISAVFTERLVWQWRAATKTFWGLLQNYRWQDAPVVLLINIPVYYNGIGIMHAEDPDIFSSHLRSYGKGNPKGKIYDVSSYNMLHHWDGAHVTVIDSNHLNVTLNQWGSWWWFGRYGAKDYENDLYSLHLTNPGHEYVLTLKQQPAGMVILYQQGDQWRVVDMTKLREEQR